ncbi:MAG: formylglycine-generating enzyme family protein, partial [Deltaproteobacteria bacterium]|nr:formylglycine-generating enzyme family protein [Deltaproteobacteria bacterium]
MLFAPGSPIASFTLSRWFVTIRRSGANESSEVIDVGNVDSVSYKPEDSCGLILETDHESIRIDTRQRGEKIGVIGRDIYGLYEEVRIKGVVQRFRYIPPGRFSMGSPADEAERRDNETSHEVILTSGYWLADTACTQELWEVVMGENPSRFKDGNGMPVENVSRDMCKEFLDKISGLEPELDLRLPTEAEWEYACRAGTVTPFSFGENITTDDVNYNGNYPYKGGEKEKYRERTVEVRSFSCNRWGLYEMHGNVWEWCEDWYCDYGSDKVVDPIGIDNGESRVLRGGSWILYGRLCRSAFRGGFQPGYRGYDTGFRLARE